MAEAPKQAGSFVATEEQRVIIRDTMLRSTYAFAKFVCNFPDLDPDFHGMMARWIEKPSRLKLGLAPRGHFKALRIDTLVPTPDGMKAMIDLHPGDYVFDRWGDRTKVVGESGVTWREDVYAVTFSTGETIVADSDHLWVTDSRRERENQKVSYAPSVKSTREIAESVFIREERNHRVSVASALTTSPKQLDFQPYALGVWLGDGDTCRAAITTADPGVIEELNREGIETTKDKARYRWMLHGGKGSGAYFSKDKSTQARLRELGVLNNKHIPEAYLFSSKKDRLDLLQGLMDTDGSISCEGQCSFPNTNRKLVEGVRFLVNSLGLKCSYIYEWDSSLNGKSCGRVFCVSFYTYPDLPVFRLDRKLKRIVPRRSVSLQNYRQIVAVERGEPCFVKCIAVESQDHQFLVGDGFIPTHNSHCWTMADKLRRVTGDPNLRVLICNETQDNTVKFISTMQAIILSPIYRWLFPEVVPDPLKARWNQTQLELKRTKHTPQPTIEGIGVGGASTSNHYDIIVNDDLCGKDARESPSVMEKAIYQRKLSWSLMVNPSQSEIHDIGTRWHPFDVADWVEKNVSNLDMLKLTVWKEPGVPWFPQFFPLEVLEQIRREQGPVMWALQYLNEAVGHGASDFDVNLLRSYTLEKDASDSDVLALERKSGTRRVLLEDCLVFQLIDAGLSPESTDARTANVVVALTPPEENEPFDIVVLEALATKSGPADVVTKAIEVYDRWNPMFAAIEVFGGHVTFFHWLVEQHPSMRIRKLPTDTKKSKDTRIREFYPFIEQGRVYVHRKTSTDLVDEMAAYPNGKTVDLLDALAYSPKIWVPPPTKDKKPKRIASDFDLADDLDDRDFTGPGGNEGRSRLFGY